MTQKNELFEQIKQLSAEEQENLSVDIDVNLLQLKARKKQSEQYISLEIPLNFQSDKSEYDKLSIEAQYSAFHAEAVFWLIGKLSDELEDHNKGLEHDVTFQSLSFVCALGVALTSHCADLIDRAEMLHNKEVKADA